MWYQFNYSVENESIKHKLSFEFRFGISENLYSSSQLAHQQIVSIPGQIGNLATLNAAQIDYFL